MMITVSELFDRFTCIFDKIVYFDKTNNIQDTETFDYKTEDIQRKWNVFLEEYGDCDVLYWLYDDLRKTMHIEFERDIYEEDDEEIVHCKDCKHLMFSDCYGECGIAVKGIVSPDDFCLRGEKK